MKTDREFERMLRGYCLTTAEIVYRLPDHPSLFQQFFWQEYDIHPYFPRLQSFLGFWETHIDGKLHRVIVTHQALMRPSEVRIITEGALH